MTVSRHLHVTASIVLMTCVLVTVVGIGASSAAIVPERHSETQARTPQRVTSSGGVRLSIPRPTGAHPVGVRSTFVLHRARTEPTTGSPRAIPARVWYPAKRRHGRSAPYFSAAVQAFVEQALGLQAGLFDINTHARVGAPARHRARGVLVFTGGFGTPVALYTGLIAQLASHGYAVVAFDHPHETFVVDQPDGSLIPRDLPDDAAVFHARLLDIGAVLGALGDLIPKAKQSSAIGIFGHSNGGAAAGEAMLRHRAIGAGVNLDGFIPGGNFLPSGSLLTAGLDRPFGLMLGLDQRPEGLREIEILLSSMRAPHPLRSPDIHHYGFSDFVLLNPQAQRADPALGTALETMFPTGTRDSPRAGRRALAQQRRFLMRFFDRYLETKRAATGFRRSPHGASWRAGSPAAIGTEASVPNRHRRRVPDRGRARPIG